MPTESQRNTGSAPALVGPTAPEQRIESLDILRGFALFGILWMNTPAGGDGGPASAVANWMGMLLAQGKFITIFSFLFGAGFTLQWMRLAKQGRPIMAFWLRRMLVLFLIGACHSVFVWNGDILAAYALLGVYLLAVCWMPQKGILLLALLIYAAIIAGGEVRFTRRIARETGVAKTAQIDAARHRERRQRMIAAEAHEYATITYPQQVRNRWHEFKGNYVQGSAYLPGSSLVLFLLGMWAVRRGILQSPASHARFLRHFVLWGLPIGLALFFGQRIQGYLFLGGRISFAGPTGTALRIGANIGRPVLGLAYVAALMLLLKSEHWRSRLSHLKWAGRMAVTNYLMQSVAFNFVAYGYGLGMFSKFTPAITLLYSLGFFIAQVWISRWWLTRFRFGPVEWLWRSLTYGRPQPWRVGVGRQIVAAVGS